MHAIKESIEFGYTNSLLGLFKFAELYSIIESKKKNENMSQIISDALSLVENKFRGISPSKKYNFKDVEDKYSHDIRKRFLYQKKSNFGRVVERYASICEGKIKQPIPDKDKSKLKKIFILKIKLSINILIIYFHSFLF